MPTPHEKLAAALEVLEKLQKSNVGAIRTTQLSRNHRELLTNNGFLKEVMSGWYVPTRPDEPIGESTSWYAAYWRFCVAYLNDRFDDGWCLSPEHSLSTHAGNLTVPPQLVVRTPKADNKPVKLPFDTSLLTVRAALPEGMIVETRDDGLRAFPLVNALVAAAPSYFAHNSTDARAALASIQDASELLAVLLDGGNSTIAGRLAGGLRNIGRDRIADDMINTMRKAGYDVREQDPFEDKIELNLSRHETSPYANRIRVMWMQMRNDIIENFPAPPKKTVDAATYLEQVDDIYESDAYNSLSIEGYTVTAELIDRVRSGNWNPELNESDKKQRDALAARGYWQAFQAVKQSLSKILQGENPGTVADDDHGDWYSEMFAPSVTANILRRSDLAGYRNGQVYIRRSMHVPPSTTAVRDIMPTFFDLLASEDEPSVRVILGHFVFVYIHPYFDGNGRIARFLMNAMLASGGYRWCVVPVAQRDAYMAALEKASVGADIVPFTRFIAELVKTQQSG